MAAIADTVIEQEVKVIAREALTVVSQATALRVVDLPSRGLAGELGRIIAGFDKQAKEKFEAIKKPIDQAHKEVCRWEHEVRDPFENAKRYLSTQIGGYDQEQERLRRAEEARLQAEARKVAEAEAARLAQEQAIQDAIALEAQGDKRGAEAVLNHPAPVEVFVSPVVVQRTIPKTVGVSSKQDWKFRITDVNQIPREYLVPDEKAIGAIVRALKGKTAIPGIEAYPEGAARFRA